MLAPALMEFSCPASPTSPSSRSLVRLTPLPVNIMVTQGVPGISDLARVGVRRVSLGPWPMMAAMRAIGQAAAAVAASKQYGPFLQPDS